MKILIIEDSKIINNVIAKELKKLGYKVDKAYTLAKAKELLEKKEYGLIVLDLHLPDGEGSELIAHIQSLTKTKVVVLTSSQDEDLREELFAYGILDYIVKDKNLVYSISEIVKIVHTVTTKKKENILVIDDSRFICKQIKVILQPRNYNVSVAYTAKEGLSKLYTKKFRLIILDMELPDVHGMELLEIIRKEKRFLDIPIIVLSGTSTPDIVRNILKNGANDYLKKPFVFEEFVLKIDLWIDYYKKEQEIKTKTKKLEFLNENLEQLISSEVEKNRRKDKLMFAQSRHAQMGEMIAMIAHQWRQPLNAIGAAMSVIDMKVKMGTLDEKKSKEITEKIQSYLVYLSSTIDDFRDFFKPQKEAKKSNFKTIVHKALDLIEAPLQNDGIKIHFDLEQTKVFYTYENELVQVIINILKNAQEAFAIKKVQNPLIFIEAQENILYIKDNAGGIPKNILERIFDPYFSTKEQKNGTGLGLYMSKIIIEEHCQGKLSVENVDNGVVFSLEIPLLQGGING